MSDMNCPYCNAEQDVNHDDGEGYDESQKHEHECSECGKIAGERLFKVWECKECGHRDPIAHQKALQEYFALVSSEIDNKEFRRFSGIESIYVASRMLADSELVKIGSNKNRKYRVQIK